MLFELEGQLADNPNDRVRGRYIMAAPGYFEFFEVPILQGRDFGPQDTPESTEVVVVNQRFAERYWPGESAIGKRIRIDPNGVYRWLEVIGVVSNVRINNAGEIEPIVYRSLNHNPWHYRRLLVRFQGDPGALAPEVRQLVAARDPDLPLFDLATLEQRMAEGRWALRLFGSVFALFGALALVMAGAGVYGLVAYSVERRTSEFGIRMALGAAGSDIRRLVVRQGLARVVIGVILGAAPAFFAGRALESLLADVSPRDPVVLLSVPAFLVAVATLACWLPALRASRVSPGSALHHE